MSTTTTTTTTSSSSRSATPHTMSSQINSVLAAIRKVQGGDVSNPKYQDFVFLDNLLQNRDFRILLNLHSSLSEFRQMGLMPSCSDSEDRAQRVHQRLGAHTNGAQSDSVSRVRRFLEAPSLKAILCAHDIIAHEDLKEGLDHVRKSHMQKTDVTLANGDRAIRIDFTAPGEPLGCALKAVPGPDESTRIVVTRVFADSLSEKTESIFVDDEVYQVNGKHTRGMTTQQVSSLIRQDQEHLSLVIIPGHGKQERATRRPMYVRARYTYKADEDTWLPCDDGGISFTRGDILEVLEHNGDYWQACVYGDETRRVGLIPSEQLQAKRMEAQAFSYSRNPQVAPVPYERVSLVQPSPNYARPIVLLGTEGVGRRTLKEYLTTNYADVFVSPLTHTSCKQYQGNDQDPDFTFVPKVQMEGDIRRGLYLEHGQHNGDLYGIYRNDVLALARQGKTCVLDIQPSVVDLVRTPELQAFVIMVVPPNLRDLRATRSDVMSEDEMREMMINADRLTNAAGPICDMTVSNHMLGDCIDTLLHAVRELHTQPQWVPTEWAQHSQRMSRGSQAMVILQNDSGTPTINLQQGKRSSVVSDI